MSVPNETSLDPAVEETTSAVSGSVSETPAVEEPTPAPQQESEPEQPSLRETAEDLNKTTVRDEPVKPMPTEESDMDSIEADPEKDEITALLENPNGPFELTTGTKVVIRQLKLREFLRLLKIISRGAAFSGGLQLDFDDPNQFVQTLIAMVLLAIPEAEDETIEFVQSMVDPANISSDRKTAIEQRTALFEELDNPEIEDLINVIGVIVASEGRDLQKLGKRLKTMFGVASKMGLTGNLTTN